MGGGSRKGLNFCVHGTLSAVVLVAVILMLLVDAAVDDDCDDDGGRGEIDFGHFVSESILVHAGWRTVWMKEVCTCVCLSSRPNSALILTLTLLIELISELKVCDLNIKLAQYARDSNTALLFHYRYVCQGVYTDREYFFHSE